MRRRRRAAVPAAPDPRARCVAGLLLGHWSLPAACLVARSACWWPAHCGCGRWSTALATVALVGGAAAAQARLAALDATALRPLVGHELTRRATLLEAPRPTSYRRRTAPSCGRRAAEAPGRPSLAPHPGSRREPQTRRLGRARGGRRGGGRRRAATRCARGTHGRGSAAPTRCSASASCRPPGGGAAGSQGSWTRSGAGPRPGSTAGLDPPEAALARGMVLGQDERLSGRPRERLPALGPCPHPGRERAERDAARGAGPAAARGGRARAARAAGRRPAARRPLRPAGRRRAVDPARGRDGRGRADRRHRRPPVIALVRAAARGGGDAPARPAGGRATRAGSSRSPR